MPTFKRYRLSHAYMKQRQVNVLSQYEQATLRGWKVTITQHSVTVPRETDALTELSSILSHLSDLKLY